MNSGYIPRNYEVFAGLDVDKSSIAATFTNHAGQLKSIKMPYNAENLLNYVRNHYKEEKIIFAYEAGPTGFVLHDKLKEQKYECLVLAAANIPMAVGQKVKTNRLDSIKISENLRGGQLKSIHVPSQSYRQLRHLVQMRDTFVAEIKATKCRIKALLLYENIAFPESSSTVGWTCLVISQLKNINCSEGARLKLDHLLSSYEFFRRSMLQTMGEIRNYCKKEEELERNIGYLRSIPGIGQATAYHLIARIGDYRELKRVNQIGSFVGLVPREKSTGDDINRGSITSIGDKRLRCKLIQCAWICINKDTELKSFYNLIYSRNNKKVAAGKAIVAVARKLTTRIFAVLTQQRNYVVDNRKQIFSLKKEETMLLQGETRPTAELVTTSEGSIL